MEKEPEPEETDPAQVGVFSGTSSNHPTGTKYFNITKNDLGSKPARVNSNTERAKFVDGIDAKVKAIFADKTDETLLRENSLKLSSTILVKAEIMMSNQLLQTFHSRPASIQSITSEVKICL